MSSALLTSHGYGRRVGLRVPSSEVDAARRWLPWWWCNADLEPEATWEVSTAAEAEHTVRQLELWVAEHAIDRVFVHAGVVVVDGAAILLPGRSYAGKSTLVRALLELGATYGSDEYAVIDAQGHVEAYPRPIALREGLNRVYMSARDLGAATLSGCAPVALVAALDYSEQTEPLHLEEQGRSVGVLGLLDNTISARTDPETAVYRLELATRDAVLVSGTRSEAHECSATLIALARAGVPGFGA